MNHTQLRPFRFTDMLVTAQAAQPYVLATVTDVQSFVPREPGTLMLVCADGLFNAIGGGHLERCAIEIVQMMMSAPEAAGEARRQFAHIPLGPASGRCCGGVVWLSLERFDMHDVEWITLTDDTMHQRRSLRRIVSADPAVTVETSVANAATAGVQLDTSGFTQTVLPPDMPIVLYGAGHIGHAIVHTLAHLPYRVTWVDERDVMFPFSTEMLPNVVIELTDTPEAMIDHVPAGSYFLVVTYNHALGLALYERIMRRADFAYFGLVGSKTKRACFEHHMVEHGVGPVRLPEVVHPIGVTDIVDRAPGIIAVSVATQLLQMRELQQHTLTSASSGATAPYRIPTSV